jgi:prephenate dehydrogenase
MTPWNQATIVGVGLVGGSLGLALKKRGLARRVIGVGHRRESLQAARAAGAADETFLDVAAGVRGSDLVVLATPVGLFADLLAQAAPALQSGAVVMDVGSTKRQVVAALEPLVPQGCAFVGCHPIAGSEQRGVAHAREDLFEGAVCVVTPTERTPPKALRRVVETWEALGMAVRTLSPELHDRLLAEVSHLPHVLAAALVRTASEEALALAGPGWADTTRVASGDASLWCDILLTNADAVAEALKQTEDSLEAFRDALRKRDAERLRTLLHDAKTRRDRVVRSPRSGPRREDR